MTWAGNSLEDDALDIEDELCGIAHIEDVEDLNDTARLPSLLRLHSHSDDGYDAQLAADIAGTTPTQSDFSPKRFHL